MLLVTAAAELFSVVAQHRLRTQKAEKRGCHYVRTGKQKKTDKKSRAGQDEPV